MDDLRLAQLKVEGESTLYDFQEIALGYTITREDVSGLLKLTRPALATPHIWMPKPVELVATAAAVAIIKNPLVTRRFWQGWGKGIGK